jgi:hypothetical protein
MWFDRDDLVRSFVLVLVLEIDVEAKMWTVMTVCCPEGIE